MIFLKSILSSDGAGVCYSGMEIENIEAGNGGVDRPGPMHRKRPVLLFMGLPLSVGLIFLSTLHGRVR